MISLFTSYYRSEKRDRQKEIDECLIRNIGNPHINRVVFVGPEDLQRPRFSNFFDIIDRVSGSDDVNIIANSDIYFDETISLARSIPRETLYWLTRWDRQEDGSLKFFNYGGSSDVWIFRGFPVNVNGDIMLGIPGCDNRIGFEFKKAGYKVVNPGRCIRGIHIHNTGLRTYSERDRYPYHLGYYVSDIEPEDYFSRNEISQST